MQWSDNIKILDFEISVLKRDKLQILCIISRYKCSLILFKKFNFYPSKAKEKYEKNWNHAYKSTKWMINSIDCKFSRNFAKQWDKE